ncbi:hypothetical protein HBO43_03495 [Pseudomonas veronii]|uniref:Uncharacterized protein n=1 Tax=Pseudomonas veronii TaxID=76761 RepID=A0A7Y0ZPI3_PSEVE|nr:hypothetical protein [Pseudomonas veronii]NMX95655.1 hypothetical protein [Pseudomonas veronii]OPK01070.1 hypothetical protein BZ164_30235 [Pseudomonas veronii]CAD0262751.1 conserved hypothetical protein [Pseudomonas veronii]SEB58927.1 hypothetical protein SAMN04490199_1832 [Pseudomonas marginalis]
MSYQPINSSKVGKAENSFREAFERLKMRKPEILPKTAQVSQNNVAREAGADPSALKKARYPELVREIQQWILENSNSPVTSIRQKTLNKRKKNRSLRDTICDLKIQRDRVATLLVEADSKILELTMDNSRLQALLGPNNINPLRAPKDQK